jgi:MHS family shikimate/dehydroshikimate transporter-like MFS transporter
MPVNQRRYNERHAMLTKTEKEAPVGWEESRKRLIPGTVLGSLLEWYDIAIYGQAAALVFGTLFFPEISTTAGRIAAFTTFGLGYFARPIGAAIFGHLGDKYGRRFSLVATLMLMGGSTVAIGLLPTFETIGILAPILLCLCRLLQGAGVGAEYVGAVTMVAEFAPSKKRGFYSSLPACGVFLGIGLAAAVSAAVATLPSEQLYSWGWRVPFLISFIVVGIGLFIRLRVSDTPVFNEMKQHNINHKLPVIAMLRTMPMRLLLVMLANTPLAFNIYVVQTYSLGYLRDIGVEASVALIAVLVGCAVGSIAIPIFGALGDRTGRKPTYLLVAAICAITPFPFFMLVNTGNTLLIYLAFALALGVGCLGMFGPQAAYFAELFDTKHRFTGFALGREIPGAVLAGPAPIIAVGLTTLAGGEPWLVATSMVVVAVISFVAVCLLPETRGRDLSSAEHSSAEPSLTSA